jgi:hypothetical protein
MVTRKQYYAIKEGLTAAEKDLIGYYELQWFLTNTVPTVEQVYKHLRKTRDNLRITSVNYYLTRKPVIKALDDRGIPWRQHSQEELTPQQQAAALTVMNFADERSIAEKLDQLGILPATYYAWLQDPVFNNFVNSLADQNKINIRPTAVAEFTKKVNSGDWNAVKFFLEVTGEFANNTAPQSEVLLRMIVEIIQKHVKDPETIMAIAQDIKLASANRTLEVVTEQPAITGEVVEDPELEHAKRQLGFG